ncbi:MAG: class I SAM-dependent methyltransferase [Desulfomonilaceae bacterium]|nr:class I SAM-dependent methyltransferase [Desulfomonilaceae bacterium]
MRLRDILVHPSARGLNPDDPRTTLIRRRILMEKGFLRNLYEEWYRDLIASLPPIEGPVLEIGSGAGFLNNSLPGLITSDVFFLPHLSVVFDAGAVPFEDGSLRAVLMIDVLHHLPRPRRFFREAARCVRQGGVVVMIEPWVTPWSTFVYSRFHTEPFEPDAGHWEFPSAGPLTGANGALPWIVFHRDRSLFEATFPDWHVSGIDLGMPFSYILSGGMTMRALMPGFAFGFVRRLERLLGPWMDGLAMFAKIVLTRR